MQLPTQVSSQIYKMEEGSNLSASSLQWWLRSPTHRAFSPASWILLALRSSSLSWVQSVLKATASASQQSPSRLHLSNLKALD